VSTTSEFEDMLRGASLRVTRPRLAVLAAVYANAHADTDSILGFVHRQQPEVSRQAVYDVLRALTRSGWSAAYAAEFKTIDLDALAADVDAALTTSRLRPLRSVHDPNGLARRRHVSHPRRSRWRRRPAVDHPLVDAADIASLKSQNLDSGLTVSALISTAWASAASFRGSDKRGGANGGRIRLEPQSGWEVNDPDQLALVLRTLEGFRQSFNAGGEQFSVADLVVLAGCAGVEKAAADAGVPVTVPFTPGRTDASAEQTDVESFAALEPVADGFRNYVRKDAPLPAEFLLIDRTELLNPSAPEMTVLVRVLRVLGANHGQSSLGVLTDPPGG
jgi:catalase (peroxidase I)